MIIIIRNLPVNPTRRTVHNISIYGGEVSNGIIFEPARHGRLCDMAGKFLIILLWG